MMSGIIRPSNLYYILAYAYRIRPDDLIHRGSERFDNHADVLAGIIVRAMSAVIRKGMVCGYTQHSECTGIPHGRMDLTRSVKGCTLSGNKVWCDYELFDMSTYPNRAIVTVITWVLERFELDPENRNGLKRILTAMGSIEPIPIQSLNWRMVDYRGHDRDYLMTLHACRMLMEEMIPRDAGHGLVRGFLSTRQEHELFEEFVRGYMDVHHRDICQGKRQFHWNLGEGETSMLLPSMEADMVLQNGNCALVVDMKCYRAPLVRRFGVERYRSSHIYQVMAYVNNLKESHGGFVEGMLLYASVGDVVMDESLTLDGSRIHFRTLDLNGEWESIRDQLESVAGMVST